MYLKNSLLSQTSSLSLVVAQKTGRKTSLPVCFLLVGLQVHIFCLGFGIAAFGSELKVTNPEEHD